MGQPTFFILKNLIKILSFQSSLEYRINKKYNRPVKVYVPRFGYLKASLLSLLAWTFLALSLGSGPLFFLG